MITAPRPHHTAALAAVMSLLTVPVVAQTQPPALMAAQSAPQSPGSDPVAELLRRQGERYRRAPDSAQDPDELRQTQALNDEIAAQNDLAENEDRANAAAYARAQAQYQSELETAEAQRMIHESDLRTAAEAQALHQRQMADWQATVAACERGDRARCNAGRQAAAPLH